MSEADAGFLLVPVNVEAFLVGEPPPSCDLSPRFEKVVDDWIVSGPELVQLFDPGWKPAPGVHLHWVLPRALAHASEHEGSDGGSGYPYAPNRWLVQRILWSPEQPRPRARVRAWVVESDAVRPPVEPGPAAQREPPITIPDPSRPQLFSHLGRCLDVDESWRDRPQKYRVPLTALGWGDPTFAASYPACKSVFGFHDPDPPVAGAEDRLAYLVLGWHSDPEQDLLHQARSPAQWQQKLAELQWSCAADPGPSPPIRTACHGAVVGLPWEGKDRWYELGVPRGDHRVAVGNSSAEALAALLTPKEREGDLLEALQHGILTSDTAPARLAEELHFRRFAASSSGTGHLLRERRAGAETAGHSPQVEIPEELDLRLEELNRAAEEAERLRLELAAERRNLYGAWCLWAKQYLRNDQWGDPPPDRQPLQERRARIGVEQARLEAQDRKVEAQRAALASDLETRCPGLELAPAPLPPYYEANEPVVAIAGPGLAPPARYGRSADRALDCRLSARPPGDHGPAAARIVDGLIVDVPNGERDVPVPAAGDWVDVELEHAAPDSPIWKLAQRLLRELLLIDGAGAESLAGRALSAAGLPSPPRNLVDHLTAAIRSTQADCRAALRAGRAFPGAPRQTPDAASAARTGGVRFDGTVPAPCAYSAWKGGNPWLPLLLQWEVRWLSDPGPGARGWIPRALWTLSAESEDFRLDRELPVDEHRQAFYRGWTVLSPHAGWVLEQRLRECSADHPELDDDALFAALTEIEVLSQSLGGFNEALLQLAGGLELPPVSPAFLTGKADRPTEDGLEEALAGAELMLPVVDRPFFPVRAGVLEIHRLWVVDVFGQRLELQPETTASPPRLRTPQGGLALAPRLVQPARLRVDWRPAAPGSRSPVCGWIVPNHLDKSYLVYDARGEPLGALQMKLRLPLGGGTGAPSAAPRAAFFWVPVPGEPERPREGVLAAFVAHLEHLPADAGNDFHRFVDSLLGSKRCGRTEDDPLLSILVGRPLALVQADVRLELAGPYPGAWTEDGAAGPGEPPQVALPLRLGDLSDERDGVVGWFDETRRRFIETWGGGGAEELTLKPAELTRVTLLLDPQRQLTLRTGVLPVQRFELPRQAVAAVAGVQRAYFLTAPVLGTSEAPRMPAPADDFGQWSWAVRPEVTLWRQVEISKADDRASSSAAPQMLSEGWLMLRMNPVVILGFWLKEGASQVPPGSRVTLSFKVEGADSVTLGIEGDDEPIETWQRPAAEEAQQVWNPLIAERRLTVGEKTLTYVLTAADRFRNTSKKTVTILVTEQQPGGAS